MHHDEVAQKALKLTRWVGSPVSIIIHTIAFVVCFLLAFFGFAGWDRMLLILTTVVSLEAIYLAIFIQMTINFTTQSIQEVSADVGEIQKDVDEIQEDVGEIQKNVDEIQEDVEDITEDTDSIDERRTKTLADIQADLQKLSLDIERLKQ